MLSSKRRAWTEISMHAVRHNFLQIKNATDSDICCVIKADAYGHGSVALAREYEKLGASYFAVSNIDEALKLRDNGISLPILNLGYAPPNDVGVLKNYDITQCVYSLDYAISLNEECIKQDAKINIHIKIDTGMSRLGFYFQDKKRDFNAIEEIKRVCGFKHFIPEGVFTHLSSSDEGDNEYTTRQLDLFNFALKELSKIPFRIVHSANSGATLDFSTAHYGMVRAGIILYGLFPSEQIRNKLNLLPVLSLKSVISHVKIIEEGSFVSYGRNFTADTQMKVATIPIGYADGYARVLSDRGAEVLINGKRRKIIGRICMDQMLVQLENDDDVNIGDTVVLIGNSGNEYISVDEIAQKRNTINYEVVCEFALRVPRVYTD